MSVQLTLATYNIHRCIGRDGIQDPDRIVAVIRSLQADVLGLQEVEAIEGAGGSSDQIEYIARTTGYRAIPGPTLFRPDGTYGNALFVRTAVTAVRRHDLSVLEREPRGAVDVDVEIGNLSLRVVTTHLGLRGWERERQIDVLLEVLGDSGARPLVLVGDMNEWNPWARRLQRLRSRMRNVWAWPTFPAPFPVAALDRILVSSHCTPVHSYPVFNRYTRRASDHLPVRMTAEFWPRK